MPKKKKQFNLPNSVWVVFDLETKHIISTYTSKDICQEDFNPDLEVVAHYELKKKG